MKMMDDMTPTLAPTDIRAILSRAVAKSHVPPEWRWHHRTLLALSERLLTHHAYLAAQAVASGEPLDTADLAAEEFDHDVALGQLSGEQDALYEIQAALYRIRAGTYGRCEVTGEPISKARLRAVPWTRFCQAVEERLENDGTLRTPHLGELRSLNRVVTRSADAEILDEEEII
jgi:RNA polymerase-binding transcription factor DksA